MPAKATKVQKPEPTTRRRPPNAGKGRKPGVPNKVNAEVRDQIIGALDDLGGRAYLVKLGKQKNPALFMAILGRVIPAHIKADVNVTNDLAALLLQAEQDIRAAAKE